MSSKKYRDRCVAYIPRKDKLLVLEHVKYPKAGIQVPAGHLETNETLDSAVNREAKEETGLKELAIINYLGRKEYDLREKGLGFERRRLYYLSYHGETPDVWIHTEKNPSRGPDKDLDFRIYWVPIAKSKLSWDHDALLHELVK